MRIRRQIDPLSRVACAMAFAAAAVGLVRAQPGSPSPSNASREVVLLYTNDFHAALEPIAAYWLPGQPRLGGAAALAGYVNRFRAANDTVFLLDAGDMFGGHVSHATRGEALMEMMRAMRYDAMALGHEEFAYGAASLEAQMARVPMPVLGANVFHKGTRHRFSRPYVILERNGVRVGVIGTLGLDARRAAPPEAVKDLDFGEPATELAPLVKAIRPQVDLVVVLAHQGKPGAPQIDAEAHRDLQRDFDEDVKLVGDVPGIDVLIGGHAHRGIERPFVHPQHGTLIVQTYGYGTRLGVLRLQLREGRLASHTGELVTTWTARVAPDADVARVVERYRRDVAARAGPPILTLTRRVYRAFETESPLGNLVADAMREDSGADVALIPAGSLHADLPDEPITVAHVQDVLPDRETVDTYRMTGDQLRELLERSLGRDGGLLQIAGLRVERERSRPEGNRVVDVQVGTAPLARDRTYTVAVASGFGQAGDRDSAVARATRLATGAPIVDVVTRYLRKVEAAGIEPPAPFVPSRWIARPPLP